MDATKNLIKLVRQKQDLNPHLSYEEAYLQVASENPDSVEEFLIEIGCKPYKSNKSTLKPA